MKQYIYFGILIAIYLFVVYFPIKSKIGKEAESYDLGPSNEKILSVPS